MQSHGWYRLAPFAWDGKVLRRIEKLPAVIPSVARELGVRVAPGSRSAPRPSAQVPRYARDDTYALEITHARNRLQVRGAPDSEELRRRIARIFQLDVDISEFHARTRESPTHHWVEAEGFGRLLCGSTLWEDTVKIIATTNTMWRQTVRMVELLVEKCGTGGAFPDPEEVARFTPDELQRDCRLGYRAKSIHALALSPPQPVEGTTEERYKAYLKLPGIGPYGAAHLLAMDGRHDFIAVDTEFRRFVRERYHHGRRVSDAAMLRHYKHWGRWKYLAYWSELHRG